MNEQQAVDKIRKLLSLAQSENEHEAASAAAMAQALMDTHRIEVAMLDESSEPDEEIETWDDPLQETSATWARTLGHQIARANGCSTYRTGSSQIICGRASKVATARYIFAYCKREIEKLAARKSGNGRTWLNNYRHGCVAAINDAIAKEKYTAREQMRAKAADACTLTDSSALVVVNSAIVKVDREASEVSQWAKRTHNLRAGSGSAARHHSGARASGRRDGASIYRGGGSTRQVGGGTKRIS
jgi:hypothetical protein